MKNDNTLDSAIKIFTEFLDQRKQRKTPERFAILKQIFNHKDHFSAEQLHQMMSKEYPVSLATVYNTLEILLESRLIIKHQFGSQIAYYEKIFGTTTHHHLICTNCGDVREFSDKKIRVAVQAKRFARFETSHYSLNLYGTCRKCKNKLNKQKNNIK